MNLSSLKYKEGSRKNRKRVGRGQGSGRGKTATRGENGQMSRSGAKHRAWFEGGQMPLQRRVPKFGFTNHFRVEYQVVNLHQLQKKADEGKLPKEGETIDMQNLYEMGLISSAFKPYKVLGHGEIKAKINIAAHGFSKSAQEKIEAAGGTVTKI